MLLATSGPNLSPKVVTSREEVSTSWSSPVASTWEEDSQQSPAVASCAPLPAHRSSRLPQPTDLTAQSANFSRESRRISREDVGTSWSSPLASTRAAGNQRSTSQRAPAPCPPTALAGCRNPPTSRPEMQTLAGKVEESAGRTSVQADPRRSRAPAQQETSGPRRSALQRPCLPTARLAAAIHRPHGQKCKR